AGEPVSAQDPFAGKKRNSDEEQTGAGNPALCGPRSGARESQRTARVTPPAFAGPILGESIPLCKGNAACRRGAVEEELFYYPTMASELTHGDRGRMPPGPALRGASICLHRRAPSFRNVN